MKVRTSFLSQKKNKVSAHKKQKGTEAYKTCIDRMKKIVSEK